MCKSPVASQESGSITQWISSCTCFFDTHNFNDEKLLSTTINFCKICNKRVTTENSGSFTQWIFGEGRCSCNKPKVDTKTLETRIESSENYLEQNVELQDREILEVGNFPYERYSPYEELGTGAAGAVYLCQDQLLNKLVAVKTLCQLTDEQLVSFQREAKTSSQLNHPSNLKVLDFGATEQGIPYMVLDYFSGIDLSKYIHDYGPLEQEQVKDIFIQLCSVLSYTHERGIFHRDITPGNILVNIDGGLIEVRLIDFGIAKVKEDLGFTTSFNDKTLAGTPKYMAPDTANGLEYDQFSEIYSIGCVMYETLLGKPPFEAPQPLQILNMHMSEEIEIPGVIGTGWSKVLSKCLAKQKEERYHSMSQLEADLKELEVVPWSPDPQDSNSNKGTAKSLIVKLVTTSLVLGIGFLTAKQTIWKESSKELEVASNEKSTSPADREFNQALKWYQNALKGKNKDDRKGQNAIKAFNTFNKLAKASHDRSQIYLANCYLNGVGTSLNNSEAFKVLKGLESKGNKAVLYALGGMYLNGRGVKKDYAKGVKYYEKAFHMGDANAANALGLIYYKGLGVKKDYKKALKYYEFGANKNNSAALVNLGSLYFNGHGVKQNYKRAIEYFERAEKLGHTKAITNMGLVYLRAKGVKQDLAKAFKYYEKAANKGNYYGLAMLGDFYYFGWGVPKNYKAAYECYKTAADNNERYGIYGVAWCHQDGNGAKKDLVLAEKLYKKTISMGELGAKKKLKEVQEELKKSQSKTQ